MSRTINDLPPEAWDAFFATAEEDLPAFLAQYDIPCVIPPFEMPAGLAMGEWIEPTPWVTDPARPAGAVRMGPIARLLADEIDAIHIAGGIWHRTAARSAAEFDRRRAAGEPTGPCRCVRCATRRLSHALW